MSVTIVKKKDKELETQNIFMIGSPSIETNDGYILNKVGVFASKLALPKNRKYLKGD